MRIPDNPQFYSANHAYYTRWSPGVQKYLRWLQGLEGNSNYTLSERYIGSLVSDIHRNLLKGGIFMYPAENSKSEGKIRLLYEAAPLAYLIEQAGGYASDGKQSILDIEPTDLHQRTPFFIGSKELVKQADQFIEEEEA